MYLTEPFFRATGATERLIKNMTWRFNVVEEE